jgi:hypothetical protein
MKALLSLALLAACGNSGPDSEETPDSAIATGDCVGEHIILQGAVQLDVRSAAAATVDGKVAAFVGASTPTSAYSLSLRDILGTDLDTTGVHDIATKPLKYRNKTVDAECPGPDCSGFFAMAGTFTVLETSPRYRATFTLSDLYLHDGDTNTLGAPISGNVTGCIDANR